MPLDHISILVPISKLEDMITFLTTSLGHLGFKELMRPIPTVVGFGEQQPYFWISTFEPKPGTEEVAADLLKKNHFAFTAQTIEEVRQFHVAALNAGATCNGEPGPRDHYHSGYYGAFVHDPVLGANFEVVCHTHKGD
ncbi:glyoxalase/bleomycin resistance protein/dioxygenase [Amylocarpus encephaloides]|uniref:Glyoxalase/bleomycin resistance protein/dioxygenase n=1 Tax=Amylocarpus encephaloides TaxID=45428 RepID=A0A9P8C1N7_9HELO|nr:glyoxalase/bleomycin resistance protein/dioxygenase [Amylocarpus encephaloides]